MLRNQGKVLFNVVFENEVMLLNFMGITKEGIVTIFLLILFRFVDILMVVVHRKNLEAEKENIMIVNQVRKTYLGAVFNNYSKHDV